jgi:hypothetical protein
MEMVQSALYDHTGSGINIVGFLERRLFLQVKRILDLEEDDTHTHHGKL